MGLEDDGMGRGGSKSPVTLPVLPTLVPDPPTHPPTCLLVVIQQDHPLAGGEAGVGHVDGGEHVLRGMKEGRKGRGD